MKKIEKLISKSLDKIIASVKLTNEKINAKNNLNSGDSGYLSDAYYKPIGKDGDLVFDIFLGNRNFVLLSIVDSDSAIIKGNKNIYFVLVTTIKYNKEEFQLSDEKDIENISMLNSALIGSKVIIENKNDLIFKVQNEFMMNYGAINNEQLYERICSLNLVTAFQISNETAREIAKTIRKSKNRTNGD